MVRIFTALVFFFSTSVFAHEMNDDPLITMIKVDRLEQSQSSDLSWDIQAWFGHDLNKVWLKTEGERVEHSLSESEIQLLYSRAIAPTWDLQLGWRHDAKPRPKKDWFAFGIHGLAPYFFETEIHAFIADNGTVNLRTKFEYDVLLTQKWILSPELQADFYSKDDVLVGVGQGLAEMELGLRLRYEISRKFAPYIGINWTQQFAKTADFSRDLGESSSDTHWLVGVQAWW